MNKIDIDRYKNLGFDVNTDDVGVAYDIVSTTITTQALGHNIQATQDEFYLNDDLFQRHNCMRHR